ncbi:hypothetical protein SNEBB_010723 [Seison nebaliae]|nr:hypothetical protein SNEBB_010723 [Seison nebaliae]
MASFQQYFKRMETVCKPVQFPLRSLTMPVHENAVPYSIRMIRIANRMVNDIHVNDIIRNPKCRPPSLKNPIGTCYSINSTILTTNKFQKRYKFYSDVKLFSNNKTSKMRASLEHARVLYQYMMLVKMGIKSKGTNFVNNQKFYGCQIIECGKLFKTFRVNNLGHLPENITNVQLNEVIEKNLFSVHRHVPILHFTQFLFQKEKFSHEWEVMYPGETNGTKKIFTFYQSFDVEESYYYSEKFNILIVNNNPYNGTYTNDMPDVKDFMSFVAPLNIWHSRFYHQLPNIIIFNYVTSTSPIYFDFSNYADYESAIISLKLNKTEYDDHYKKNEYYISLSTRVPYSHLAGRHNYRLTQHNLFGITNNPKDNFLYHTVGYIISNSIYLNCNERMAAIIKREGRPLGGLSDLKNNFLDYVAKEKSFLVKHLKNEQRSCPNLKNCVVDGCKLFYPNRGHAIAIIMNLARTQWYLINNHMVIPILLPYSLVPLGGMPPTNQLFELTTAHLSMYKKLADLIRLVNNLQ